MDNKKKLGIWMDHSSANLIDVHSGEKKSSIKSRFSFNVKEEALQKGEKRMHNKEQQLHEAFYKEIGAEILKYDHVLLFGPTNAKSELYNYLNKDLHFKEIQFDIESADKMTDPEKEAFVKKHFNE